MDKQGMHQFMYPINEMFKHEYVKLILMSLVPRILERACEECFFY